MNIQGKLHAIFEAQQVSEKFRKRDFVVEYSENPMYPQYISFQLVQDRCELISSYQIGDTIDVSFNLRGRMWNAPGGETKYFNTLEAWRINPGTSEQPGTPQNTGMANQPSFQQTATNSPTPPAQTVDVTKMDDDDDLPF